MRRHRADGSVTTSIVTSSMVSPPGTGAGVGVPPSGISVGAEGGGSHAIGGRQVIFGADSDGLGPVLRSGVYTVSGARVSNSPSPLSHHDSGKRLLQLGRCLMADPQHIAWLKEGERSWNARRQIQQFDPDLSSEDISRALGGHEREDISEISVRLQDANFSGANLSNSTLRGTDLTAAKFYMANLNSVKLTGSDLTGGQLFRGPSRGARLHFVKFIKTLFH